MAEQTQSFKYTGLSAQGKRIEGVIKAADLKDAQAELKKMKVDVVSLTPKKGMSFGQRRVKKIKPKEVQLFTRFLSTMLASGLPIMQSLDIIAHDQENPSMEKLILNVKNDIAGGKTLAETFNQYPKQFSSLYVSLIKAGEKSGTLDKILNRLAGYLEKTESMKRKVKKALTYPIAILTVAIAVSLILLIFVVPQFQKMFESFDAELPVFTQMVVHLSDFLRAYWWAVIGGIGLLIFGLVKTLKGNPGAIRMKDKLILRIYIIGPVLRKSIIARFTRTLSTTLEAGMPIVESMKSMAPIMGNSVYEDAILKMCDDINSGHTLSSSMISTKLFPNMVIQMISVGEASGRLSDMLNKVADFYEDEVNNIVDNLSSLLEPLIMIVLGVVVGGFIVAMYLPIFRIGSLF